MYIGNQNNHYYCCCTIEDSTLMVPTCMLMYNIEIILKAIYTIM